jgi:hypothetical protein
MRIVIERMAADKIARQVWVMDVIVESSNNRAIIRLLEWRNMVRITTRHGWKIEGEAWQHRSVSGRSRAPDGFRKTPDEVPFPPDVIAEAKEALMSRTQIEGPGDPSLQS